VILEARGYWANENEGVGESRWGHKIVKNGGGRSEEGTQRVEGMRRERRTFQ
jgi:hypothetical protein